MSFTRDPDRKWIQNFQQQREFRSFDLLVKKYQDQVYNFCYRFLGDKEDASDCSQEIFIKLYEHIDGFRFRSTFSTWLYKIMLNSCRDMAKARKYRQSRLISTDLAAERNLFQYLPGPTSSAPDSQMTKEELNTAFQKALARLKDIRRKVLILRDIEGRSYEEISCITRLKTGTVRSTLARARYEVANYLNVFRNEM